MPKVWRQGDIVVQEIPTRDFGIGETKHTIEFPSETGTPHTIQVSAMESMDESTYEFRLDQPTQLVHPVHQPIALPSGSFRAFRIRDFDRRFGD